MAESKLLGNPLITTLIQKGVEIRAADAAVTHRYQNFAEPWSGHGNLLDIGGARGTTQSSQGFHVRNKLVSGGCVNELLAPQSGQVLDSARLLEYQLY